ncbi:MAG TPA: hypothetical protein VK183_08995 [Flavobacterium sp.]|nr:hypothetical protein [Flavobacterium sp.]
MKKVLALVFIAFFALSSCEDGEIRVQSLDFGDAQVDACDNREDADFFLYKISGNQAMIVVIPKTELINGVSDETFDIDGSNYQVIYRLYDGPVSAATMCSPIPPSSPQVQEEWVATGGVIRLVNGANFLEVEGSTAVLPDGYTHTLSFENITFDTGDGTVTFDDEEPLAYGTYKTEESNLELTTFRCDNENGCVLDRCGTRITRSTQRQALTLDFDQTTFDYLFANEVTAEPKTALISGTNTISYRVFNIGISADNLCAATLPSGVTTLETWVGNAGVDGVSGIIEVETTTAGVGNYIHKIRLKNVIFSRNGFTFNFGPDYLIGQIVTGS